MRTGAIAAFLLVTMLLAIPSLEGHHRPWHTVTPSSEPPTPTTAPTLTTDPPPTDTPTPTPLPSPTPTTSSTTSTPKPPKTTTATTSPSSPDPFPPSSTPASGSTGTTGSIGIRSRGTTNITDYLGNDAPFARIDLEPYPRVDKGQSRVLTARIEIKEPALQRAFALMAKGLTYSEGLEARARAPTAGGAPLLLYEDRLAEDSPTFMLRLDSLSERPAVIEWPFEVTTDANGFFRLGVYVLLFDAQWQNLEWVPGVDADLFGETSITSSGHGGVFAAPFVGAGNAVPGASAWAAMAAAAASLAAIWLRRRGP